MLTKPQPSVRSKEIRRFVWLPMLALILITLAAGAVATWLEASSADQFLRGLMLTEARMIAQALDPTQVARLTGTAADLQSADYQYLQAQLVRVRTANPRYRYLYLMGQRPGGPPFFFMGTAPADSPDYSPPGQVYFEEAPALTQVFATHEARISDPVTDRWGTWISALVPMTRPDTGEFMAIFGMDFDASDWQGQILYRALAPVGLTLFAVVLQIALAGLIRYRQSQQENQLLAATAAELETFFAVTPDLLCIADQAGRFVKVNAAWQDILGYSAEAWPQSKFMDWVHPDDRALTLQALQNLAKQAPLQFTNRYQCQDGSYRFIEWHLQSHGELIYSAARDITERKRAEAEREKLFAELGSKNVELERFTYTVSHDLKAPLITIRGFLSFLEKDALAGNLDRLQADVTRIRNAADKMQQLLGELLELSRIGRMMNPSQTVPFETIAREAAELAGGPIAARSVHIDIAENLPAVYGDRARLVEVVLDLIDNAVKFTGDQPHPRIEIGARPAPEGPVFYVRDNGIGIEPPYHEKVFGLFEKLNAHSAGTGIGLALVKRIIEVHGGRIWVESEGLDQGATFCFTLPLKDTALPSTSV